MGKPSLIQYWVNCLWSVGGFVKAVTKPYRYKNAFPKPEDRTDRTDRTDMVAIRVAETCRMLEANGTLPKNSRIKSIDFAKELNCYVLKSWSGKQYVVCVEDFENPKQPIGEKSCQTEL
jgi:hypothetical protein